MDSNVIPLKLCMASQACIIESLIKENEGKSRKIDEGYDVKTNLSML